MRIAVCDDEQEICSLICSYINTYMANSRLTYSLECFNSAEELLSSQSVDFTPYDIYFLDIYMGDINGIHLAEAIRAVDIYTQIVFITGSEEHRQPAFEVQAFYYMVKPFTQEQFSLCLSRLLRIKTEQTKINVINSDGDTIELSLDHILYIESIQGQAFFYTKDSSFYTSQTLNDLNDILPHTLYRCHKSFIVNMKHIQKRYKDKCLLYNGAEVPVGRKYTLQFRKDYFTHLRRKAN